MSPKNEFQFKKKLILNDSKKSVNFFFGMRTQMEKWHTSLARKFRPWCMSSVYACAVRHLETDVNTLRTGDADMLFNTVKLGTSVSST
jgi:hypothetical protein